MDVQEQWTNFAGGKDEDLTKLLQSNNLTNKPSKNPLTKIKTNLIINGIWAALIGVFYIFILYYYPMWPIIICIGIVMLFTFLGLFSALSLWRKLNCFNADQPILQQLENHYDSLTKWNHLQLKVGLFIYPISAAGGFMLGGCVGSGKPIQVFMQKPAVIITLVVVTAILVPLCHKLAKWMMQKSFGKHIDAMQQNIEALKEE
jgi:membrane protein YdbS with pleckstrin-like domain